MHSFPISIVVPVCNAALTLGRLADSVRAAMSAEEQSFELIFVDDASEDESWQLIEGLHAADRRIRGLSLEQRAGQHSALLCGLRAASHEVVVTIDDDLEHPPQEIAKLLLPIAQGADLVYGTPLNRTSSLWRRAGALLARLFLARELGFRAALRTSPFRAFRASLRDGIPKGIGPKLCLDLYLNKAARRASAVRVRYAKSELPASRYGPRQLVGLAFRAGRAPAGVSPVDAYRVCRVVPDPSGEN